MRMKIKEAYKFGAHPSILDKLEAAGLDIFTVAQEKAIKCGLCHGKSIVLAAPTSSGKTTIAEIAAITGAINGQKSIYLVSHKALAEEKYLSFKSEYDNEENKWFDISIATGDHTEGDWNNGILVATYEKYLSLLSSSTMYSVKDKVVVADELQILSDPSRGPDIEVLLTIIKQQQPSQFIALSATAPNVDEIAGWLGCECVNISYRDVPLRQETWFNGRRYYAYHGDEKISEDHENLIVSEDTLQAVRNLLDAGLGPILVFTMTRQRAVELAELFSQTQQQDVKSYVLVEQLELFSEPTEISTILRQTSERKVAFHSADLSFSERTVVEAALRKRSLDVVFSTPTLAAGVNFPIRTVIFDSFTRFWEAIPWLPKSEYVNMAGRAGRLGLDEEGMAILIARNRADSIKARDYLSPELEPLNSRLFDKSIRKSVLNLISSRICRNEKDINRFYSDTFWWFQTLEHNPIKLEKVAPMVSDSIKWHFMNELIVGDEEAVFPTPLGIAISSSGLLPSTGIFLLSLLRENDPDLSNDESILAIIHAICASDEFNQEHGGQRFLPFARRNQPERVAWQALLRTQLFINPNAVENFDRVANAAYGLYLWSQGLPEHDLRRTFPRISYGQFHTIASDVSWVLDGLASIVSVPGIGFKPELAMRLGFLADRVRFGVHEEALDILKAARASDVPGFGRQRAMALKDKGLSEPNTIARTGIEILNKIVQGIDRARALVEAVTRYFSINFARWRNRHMQRVMNIADEEDLIEFSYDSLGHEYEDIIQSILESFGWDVKKLDVGKRQGVPDFIIYHDNRSILVECKTKKSNDATIDKEDAFEVLTKGVDINADHRVTIGKPDFDTFSKSKAAGSKMITLIPHYALIEAFLRWREGKLAADDVFEWLITPGVALLDLLPTK